MYLHDVALTLDVSISRDMYGRPILGGGAMRYAIFDTAEEAEEFAKKNEEFNPLVSYRNWHPDIFYAESRLEDHRKGSNRGIC
jgi:hypothetical protein